MFEPTWSPIAMPSDRRRGDRGADVLRRPVEADVPDRERLVCAAPFAVAALWIAVTGASFLFWSITGRLEPLDWCRSGSVLTVAAALTALAALGASATQGVTAGRYRFASDPRHSPDLSSWQDSEEFWLDRAGSPATDF